MYNNSALCRQFNVNATTVREIRLYNRSSYFHILKNIFVIVWILNMLLILHITLFLTAFYTTTQMPQATFSTKNILHI